MAELATASQRQDRDSGLVQTAQRNGTRCNIGLADGSQTCNATTPLLPSPQRRNLPPTMRSAWKFPRPVPPWTNARSRRRRRSPRPSRLPRRSAHAKIRRIAPEVPNGSKAGGSRQPPPGRDSPADRVPLAVERLVKQIYSGTQRLGQLAALVAGPQMMLDRIVIRPSRGKRASRQGIENFVTCDLCDHRLSPTSICGSIFAVSLSPPSARAPALSDSAEFSFSASMADIFPAPNGHGSWPWTNCSSWHPQSPET